MGVVLMAFTVFDSFAEVYDDFDASDPEDLRDRAMLADAIMMYGLHGVEADLPKHLRRVFKAMKNAIDNSKDARGRGGKGGRPRKKPVSDKPETQVSESENLGFSNGKPVSDKPETPVSESENPNLTYPSLSCTELDCTELACDGGDAPAAPPEFEPPSLEEARGYFGANCLSGDPDAFWAYFESQGWVKGNGQPVSNWGALALDWSRRQKRIDADDRARGKPTASEVEAATFKPTRTPEQTRAELERRWREEHPGIDPAKVKAPRGTTADPVALKAYQDARRLLDARAACERRAS
jgi:hypothetical protein